MHEPRQRRGGDAPDVAYTSPKPCPARRASSARTGHIIHRAWAEQSRQAARSETTAGGGLFGIFALLWCENPMTGTELSR